MKPARRLQQTTQRLQHPLRALPLLWLAFALLLQPLLGAAQASAASGLGFEVCSAAGPVQLGPDGQPLDRQAGGHTQHECCQLPTPLLPGVVPALAALEPAAAGPALPRTALPATAPRFAPPATGPPARA